jgi:plasmid stability protein
MEEEVRDILQNAVKNEGQSRAPLGSSIAARFTGCGLDVDIPEQRGATVRPASFE